MMKSMFAMLCMLFALFTTTMVYAEEATDDTAVSNQDEPLPPLMDPAMSSDASGQ